MTNYLPTRKIKQIEVEGVGTINLREPSAMLRIRLNQIRADSEPERETFARAEFISACVVDDNGKQLYPTADSVLNGDLTLKSFDLISAAILNDFTKSAPGEPEKNSDQTPLSSPPSSSPEN